MALYNGHQEDSSGNILLSIGNGMTATLETGTTASQAYTKGAYVFFNNRLCKATAAISSGNTLSIGTNLAQTSMGEELTSHLRASNGDEFYFDYKDGKAGYYPTASKIAADFVSLGGSIGWQTQEKTLSLASKGSGTVIFDEMTDVQIVYAKWSWYREYSGIASKLDGTIVENFHDHNEMQLTSWNGNAISFYNASTSYATTLNLIAYCAIIA